MRTLDVYMNDVKAGILTEETPGRGYVFRYVDDYLKSQFPSISVNLRKREEPYISETIFPFFYNMVPEGGNRRVICRFHHIDEEDIFSLLYVMADKDCIGAVNMRKPKQYENFESVSFAAESGL